MPYFALDFVFCLLVHMSKQISAAGLLAFVYARGGLKNIDRSFRGLAVEVAASLPRNRCRSRTAHEGLSMS
jgi:hypothetical protein